MSLLPLVATRGMNAQPIPLKPGEEALIDSYGSFAQVCWPHVTDHSCDCRYCKRCLSDSHSALTSGRRWLETEQPPKQPDLVSQIRIVGFQPRFEYSGSAWAAFTIVNDNPFPITDIILRCDFQGANEVHVHMRGPVVPAKGQKAFDEFLRSVSSKTRNSNCAVVDAHRQY